MRNIEKRQIMINEPRRPGKATTKVALFIAAIREDERKALFNRFSDRLATIKCKSLSEKMTADEIIQLLSGESEHFSNLAAELNHV